MWEWVVFLTFIAGAILFFLYVVAVIVFGLQDFYAFIHFYYRLFSGNLSIREMRDDIKKRRAQE